MADDLIAFRRVESGHYLLYSLASKETHQGIRISLNEIKRLL